jgi:hypothetical protein
VEHRVLVFEPRVDGMTTMMIRSSHGTVVFDPFFRYSFDVVLQKIESLIWACHATTMCLYWINLSIEPTTTTTTTMKNL